MHAHLDGCPACAEDHDSLHALVKSEQQFPVDTALSNRAVERASGRDEAGRRR